MINPSGRTGGGAVDDPLVSRSELRETPAAAALHADR